MRFFVLFLFVFTLSASDSALDIVRSKNSSKAESFISIERVFFIDSKGNHILKKFTPVSTGSHTFFPCPKFVLEDKALEFAKIRIARLVGNRKNFTYKVSYPDFSSGSMDEIVTAISCLKIFIYDPVNKSFIDTSKDPRFKDRLK